MVGVLVLQQRDVGQAVEQLELHSGAEQFRPPPAAAPGRASVAQASGISRTIIDQPCFTNEKWSLSLTGSSSSSPPPGRGAFQDMLAAL